MENNVESFKKTQLSGKTLVIYYSRGGNTRTVAEKISKRLGADIEEIVDGTKKKHTGSTHDPSDYGLVVVGTPVNGFTVSKPVTEYLNKNRARFNEVAVYATYSLWPAGTLDKMGKLSGKNPIAATTFKSRDIKLNRIDGKVNDFVSLIQKGYAIPESYPMIEQVA